ncbi:hypothetical protein LEP1GSC061_3387 [Leptospira wolffii serovar Khorat str. Khorat-H2]|nr:hypothetical protein LEP1GSC061_3387 [Leptospira wolffii serovar Khorat str. Khorat-H2]
MNNFKDTSWKGIPACFKRIQGRKDHDEIFLLPITSVRSLIGLDLKFSDLSRSARK